MLIGNTLYPLFLSLRIQIVPKIVADNFETHHFLPFLHPAMLYPLFRERQLIYRGGDIWTLVLYGQRDYLLHLLEMARTRTHR